MKKQNLLVVIENQSEVKVGELSTNVFEAHVNDQDELTVKVSLPLDELGRVPLNIIRFNRYETIRIRRVLEHTK